MNQVAEYRKFTLDGAKYSVRVSPAEQFEHYAVRDREGNELGTATIDHRTETAYIQYSNGEQTSLNYYDIPSDTRELGSWIVATHPGPDVI